MKRDNFMDFSFIFLNLFSPPILFFILGACSSLLHVDLVIPNPIARFLSLYLLFSIGFQGGIELQHAGITVNSIIPLGILVILSCIITFYTFFLLLRKLNVYDAAAIAATYGSVSAVAFITATNFLQTLGYAYDGFMVAALAIVESPAIIIGLYLTQKFAPQKKSEITNVSIIHEALFNSSVFLILGSLFIGFISGAQGAIMLKPFTHDIFKGMLTFFMLDIGILAAKRLQDLKKSAAFLVPFAIIIPFMNGILGIITSYFLHLSIGNSFLIAVITSSASYIAVPAAMRISIPQANPGLYIPMALAITFPFNILICLPVYMSIIRYFWV
jgi:uncharacterized protein